MYHVRGDDRYAHLTRFQVIPAVLLSSFFIYQCEEQGLARIKEHLATKRGN